MHILLQNFPRGYLIVIIALVTFLTLAINIQFHTKLASDININDVMIKSLAPCNISELPSVTSKCLTGPIIEDWQKIT